VDLVRCSMVRAFQKALTIDFGIESTYEHSHILKLDDSYVKNCKSSCCFLAAFLICSHCECLENNLTVRLWYYINYSYVGILESSRYFLAEFLIRSCCDIVSIVTRAVVKWALVKALTS
jgi:hypothetical protein